MPDRSCSHCCDAEPACWKPGERPDEPNIPIHPRVLGKQYRRKPDGGKKSRYRDQLYFSAIVYVLRTGIIGNGNPPTVRRAKPRSPWKLSAPIPRTGGKNGSKRNLLVDANGIPLSLVATGANQHDSAVLDELLWNRVVPLDFGHAESLEQNLCLDAGYFGKA